MHRLGELRAVQRIAQIAVAAGFIVAAVPGIVPAEAAKRGGVLNFAVVAEPPNYDCHASTTLGVLHPVGPHYRLCSNTSATGITCGLPDVAES
jgi:peptide/nickel transport system substrate-binding protein